MATICYFWLLLFFTPTLSINAKLNLDPPDHLAIFKILADLGVSGELPRSDDLCNAAGIFCEPRISKKSYVLKVTRIVFKTQRLRGSLSPAIGQLSELKELSLPNNYLFGRIPPQIAHCRKLEVLRVCNNNLSGKVPGELSSLLRLRILDLSSNLFSGDLSFLKYFPNLEKLSLDNNMFTGKVPVSLSSFKKLRFFSISGDSFLEPALNQLESSSLNYKHLPKRYLLAELTNSSTDTNGNKNSGSNSPQAPTGTPNNKHSKKKRKINLGVIVVTGITSMTVFLMLLLLVVVMVKSRGKKSIVKSSRPKPLGPRPRIFVPSINASGPRIFCPWIKAEELAFLNDEDSVAALQVIGKGGCGEVYRMERLNEKIKTIAIKKITRRSLLKRKNDQTISRWRLFSLQDTNLHNYKTEQIQSELMTVSRIRHRNLLPLLAHIGLPNCHFFVYEFMQNGSLHDILKQVNDGARELDWPARHKIALDVASGLEYLHFSVNPRMVHRDLKPANVLLNDDMTALITDFGLASFIYDDETHLSTTNIAGTVGYIAPEYYQTMEFTDKCDIYSFGVLLGCLVIGKFPSDEFFQETPEMSMVRWMRSVMKSDNPKEAIDPKLLGNGYEEQMLLVLNIACLCTLDNPWERPDSRKCSLMLNRVYIANLVS